MSDPKMKTRWIIVIGAIMIQLCLGAIYAWGAFTSHLQSSKENLIMNYQPELLGLDDNEVKAEKERIFGKNWNDKAIEDFSQFIQQEAEDNKDTPYGSITWGAYFPRINQLLIEAAGISGVLKIELYNYYNSFKDACTEKPDKFKENLAIFKETIANIVMNFQNSKNIIKTTEGNQTEIIPATQYAMLSKIFDSSMFKFEDGKVPELKDDFFTTVNNDAGLEFKKIKNDDKTLALIFKDVEEIEGVRRIVDNIVLNFKKTPPIQRSLFNKVSDETWEKYYYGFSAGNTQLIFAIGLATFAFVMIFAGRWQDKKGPKVVAITGGVILGLGYIFAGLFAGTNFILMLIFIGLMGGAGIGFGYVCPIAAGSKWFPDKKGLISGLAVAGFGAGALIFVKLSGTWANLINNHGVNTTFFIYGIIFIVVVVLGALFLSNPPKGWKPTGFEGAAKKINTGFDFTWKQMLKTRQFYMLWFTFILSAGAGLMVIGILKDFGYFEGGLTLATAANAVAMLAIFNGLGRIIWGSISDKIGRKFAINLMVLLQGLMLLGILFIGKTSSGLTIAACWIGFNFGGNFALFPAATADYFGLKNLGTNYGWMFTAYGVGGIFGPIMGGKIFDLTGSYSLAFIVVAVLMGVAWFLSMMFKMPKEPAVVTKPEVAEKSAE